MYLDFSKTSLQVAKTRASYRQLNNIVWEHDMIERIPEKNLGSWSFILFKILKSFYQENLTL